MTDEQRVELWKWFAESRVVAPRTIAKVDVFVLEPPKRPAQPKPKKRSRQVKVKGCEPGSDRLAQ